MKRILACALVAGLLGGCANGPWIFHDAYQAAKARKADEKRYRADTAACGHAGGSEWCRLAADDGNLSRLYPGNAAKGRPAPGPVYAFDASQCDGVYDHGLCRGVSRAAIPPPACHGETIDGVCAGPEF